MDHRSNKSPVPRAGDPSSPAVTTSPSASAAHRQTDHGTAAAICILLAAITLTVFGQTLWYEFVTYDDNVYVYDNPAVSGGLSAHGFVWAFTHFHGGNWHPLTTLSHMLDCQLYGLNPGGHHFTSVVLHATVAILLFLVLRKMTGTLWRSAVVAAVFAIHPLRVESVAWIAERKDVLSGLFFMLTLGAYARYVAQPVSLARYLVVVVCFSLGLMSKPMLVTLPFLLLLLDYWPLKRFPVSDARRPDESGDQQATCSPFPCDPPAEVQSAGRLVVEKIPLFALSAVVCVITVLAQTTAIVSIKELSFPARIGNALVSYTVYLRQMFYPVGLAVLYPLSRHSALAITFSIALLASISLVVIVGRRRHRYLLAGWFWYLGMLVPVIGVVQVGITAHADRYTYLPQIGLYLLLTWAVADCLSAVRRRPHLVCGATVAILLAILTTCAWIQTSYWRNSRSLWTHTLSCTSRNSTAHNNLGETLQRQGKIAEAIVHFDRALQIDPDDPMAHNNLGVALWGQGKIIPAVRHYQRALRINPAYAEAHHNLGIALDEQGNIVEAIAQYRQALRIKPAYTEAHINLGNALQGQGKFSEAIEHYRRALRIKPADAMAHNNLGVALQRQGRIVEAIEQYRQALRIKPDYADARNNLGKALWEQGRS